jgi:undecaprenyl phosphate-alpha-L-ara4FN deformylase
MKIALRVCVNSLQGALKGLPNLLRLFDTYQVQASFFFALGPDMSGRGWSSRCLQPWYPHLDLSSRLYGLLLPPPNISRRAAVVMRSVAEAGHETGLLCHDRHAWVSRAAFADKAWTERQVMQGVEDFEHVFQAPPIAFAAAGWQVNPHLLQLEQTLAFDYASDVRGKSAFLPVLQGVTSSCPQLPTTLPLLGDLLRAGNGITAENAHEYLYAESQYIAPHGHVYSLDAEMEGLAFLPLMEKLLVMWRGYGGGLTSLGDLNNDIQTDSLARHQIGWSREESGACHVATQSVPV